MQDMEAVYTKVYCFLIILYYYIGLTLSEHKFFWGVSSFLWEIFNGENFVKLVIYHHLDVTQTINIYYIYDELQLFSLCNYVITGFVVILDNFWGLGEMLFFRPETIDGWALTLMKCDDKLGGRNKPCGWTWVHLWRQNGGQFLPLININQSKFSFAFMHLGVVNILFRPNTITQSQNTINSSFQF